MKKKIYVFATNLAGRHGKGNALTAYRNYGAVYGQGNGLQGDSYAIPTADEHMKLLPLNKVEKYVEQFIKFAELNPEMQFEVSRIGCETYEDTQIAPLFKKAPNNCILPAGWRVLANN